MAQPDRSGQTPPTQRIGPAALRRLRWRARRGLLENDLLIGRFLDRRGEGLQPDGAAALALLLDLSEADLLDLLLERRQLTGELDAPAVRDILAGLRSIRLDPMTDSTSGA